MANLYGTLTAEQFRAAILAHEANRVYCASIGDSSQSAWEDSPEWQRNSSLKGVMLIWDGTKTAQDVHESWLREKGADGWHYGPVKDEVRKTHPAFLPYKDLPDTQKVKDHIFRSIVLGYKAICSKST